MKKIIALLMAVMLIASIAIVTASAESSPQQFYKMTARAEGSGEASVAPSKVEVDPVTKEGKEVVTFTATEKGAKFVKWELHCEYDIVEGSLTTPVLKVLPKSDIEGVAFFDDADKASKDEANKDTTAPKTGDMTLIFAGLMLLALGAGVFAVKKIKE